MDVEYIENKAHVVLDGNVMWGWEESELQTRAKLDFYRVEIYPVHQPENNSISEPKNKLRTLIKQTFPLSQSDYTLDLVINVSWSLPFSRFSYLHLCQFVGYSPDFIGNRETD